MINGKTSTGFEFQLHDECMDDMELLERMMEIQNGNPAALIPALKLLLGEEQKNQLYNHLRICDGRVPVKATAQAFAEICQAARKGKN